MRTVTLRDGAVVPALGQGTWMMGEDPRVRAEEIATLRAGLDLGATLIDTAEMYGEGAAEELIGEALAGRREEAFLVSKVYPHHGSRDGVVAACERSLRRLRTDRLDLYLLHWRGDTPLAETIEGFERLIDTGKIRRWGVSNFDPADMAEVASVAGGAACATDQVLYNLVRRGIEWDLLPWAVRQGLPIMAYSPIEQAGLARDPRLVRLAESLGATAAAVALAWVLDHPGVIAIPKASRRAHLADNVGALDLRLTEAVRHDLDRMFPPPKRAVPLEML